MSEADQPTKFLVDLNSIPSECFHDLVLRHTRNFILMFTTQTIGLYLINLLTPTVNYSGRTATLTSKFAFYIFIQQI